MQRLLLVALAVCSCVRRPAAAPATDCTEGAKEVRVDFSDQQLVDASFKGTRLDTLWLVKNPYDEPVTLASWMHQLVINQHVLAPSADPTLTVGPHACKVVTISSDVVYADVFGTDFDRKRTSSAFNANVAPVATTSKGEERPKATHTGSFRLAGVPDLRLWGFKVERTGEGAVLNLTVALENPNGFPLELGGFDAEFLIFSEHIGRVRAPPGPALGARERRTFDYKIRVEFMNIGGMSRTALKSTEPMAWDLKGKLAIESLEFPIASGGMTRASR